MINDILGGVLLRAKFQFYKISYLKNFEKRLRRIKNSVRITHVKKYGLIGNAQSFWMITNNT